MAEENTEHRRNVVATIQSIAGMVCLFSDAPGPCQSQAGSIHAVEQCPWLLIRIFRSPPDRRCAEPSAQNARLCAGSIRFRSAGRIAARTACGGHAPIPTPASRGLRRRAFRARLPPSPNASNNFRPGGSSNGSGDHADPGRGWPFEQFDPSRPIGEQRTLESGLRAEIRHRHRLHGAMDTILDHGMKRLLLMERRGVRPFWN